MAEEHSRVNERREGYLSVYKVMGYDDFFFPFVSTITDTTYPAQNEEYVGQEIPLWYYDERLHETKRGVFTVIRWDDEEPNKVALYSNDPPIIIVSSASRVEDLGEEIVDENGKPVNNSCVHRYPIQDDRLLGVATVDEYPGSEYPTKINGIILRADMEADNPQIVIWETLEDGTGRLVLGSECRAVVAIDDVRYKPYTTSAPAMSYLIDVWPEEWRANNNETDTSSEDQG